MSSSTPSTSTASASSSTGSPRTSPATHTASATSTAPTSTNTPTPVSAEHRDWGTQDLQLRPPGGRELPLSQRALLARRLPRRRPARRCRRFDALSRLFRASPASGSPTRYGGNENLEAIEFLKRFNDRAREHPGILDHRRGIDSLAGVSRPTYLGGLGFSLKWDMGWMNDTLALLSATTRSSQNTITTRSRSA